MQDGPAGEDHAGLVPSAAVPDGLAALELLLDGADSVSVAVAFVSREGARLLIELLERHAVPHVELVARGAPITDPDALVLLRDAGVAVSVVMETEALRFHPKLWLSRGDGALSVLSGSGNLTHGGLRENREQFELLRMAAPSAAAQAQEERYIALVQGAKALEEVEGGAAWLTWRDQLKRRRPLWEQLQRFDDQLAATRAEDRTSDKRMLLDDLDRLYERIREEGLRRGDGQRYVPHRFRRGLARARARNDPVSFVANICRRTTRGFDVLLAADRPELTVEWLVVEARRPYQSLFREETRRLAAERLRRFPSFDRQ